MEAKHDQPPAYGGPQAPQPSWQGQPPQQGYAPSASMDYYGQQQQGGHPQQYGGQYGQPGGYPPQQGGYPPQGYPPQGQYQEQRGGGNGCLHALLGALACCCCLDCLF
ncbi:hypothetical protein MKZ38_009408 [Zalerion maritima]|uniref:Cysteine-rich transmembrane CYSTM domain-containing protein n=1 Tax=Zalerion maritima TaxID=339359 RepID=A0AAD5RVA0_9PEZI|nr:hypothetical protein MKZ38_009408 [Zalerion maritima]